MNTSGHLNELRIADTAAQHGFKVKGIGVRFIDQIKAAPTDIDVLLERSGKSIAIEAKDYSATTQIPLDAFRADMSTLAQFPSAPCNSGVHSHQSTIRPARMGGPECGG